MEEQIFGGEHHTGRPARPALPSILRGMLGKCPRCGEGRLFASFLTTVKTCEHCGENIYHHRADDLPAYLVIFVVGHVVVGAFMGVEAATSLSLLQHMMIWIPATLISALALLRPVKGAVVGLQWAFYMHGFGGQDDAVESHPEL